MMSSIIIPFYNSQDYIREAIESALQCLSDETEVIAVDDGSTDHSSEIVSEYSGVRLVKQNNSGACRARNHGLELARGKFIKFLDADDYIDAQAFKKQLEASVSLDAKTILYSDAVYFDNDSGETQTLSVTLDTSEDQTLQLLRYNIQTCLPLHRKDALLEVGGFCEEFLRAQEYYLHLKLSTAGYKFKHFPMVGAYVREHSASHRISNQVKSEKFLSNGAIRREMVLTLLQETYGHPLPYKFNLHYSKSAWEGFIVAVKNGHYSSAKQFLKDLKHLEPGITCFAHGLSAATMQVGGNKLRQTWNTIKDNRKLS